MRSIISRYAQNIEKTGFYRSLIQTIVFAHQQTDYNGRGLAEGTAENVFGPFTQAARYRSTRSADSRPGCRQQSTFECSVELATAVRDPIIYQQQSITSSVCYTQRKCCTISLLGRDGFFFFVEDDNWMKTAKTFPFMRRVSGTNISLSFFVQLNQ